MDVSKFFHFLEGRPKPVLSTHWINAHHTHTQRKRRTHHHGGDTQRDGGATLQDFGALLSEMAATRYATGPRYATVAPVRRKSVDRSLVLGQSSMVDLRRSQYRR